MQIVHGTAHRLFQWPLVTAGGTQILFHQVGNDFRVCFGQELVAFLAQLFLEGEVVLDDAVVDDHHPAGAVAMRVGVLFRRAAMGCPAGVADAIGAVDGIEADGFFQVAQFAFGAANLQPLAVARHRDSGRIVAAVLQLLQPVQNDRNHPLLTYITNNSAHLLTSNRKTFSIFLATSPPEGRDLEKCGDTAMTLVKLGNLVPFSELILTLAPLPSTIS